MVKTIEATFDGAVLRPESPLALKPNTRVRTTIEVVEPRPGKPKPVLDTARSLNVEGPPDWAANIEACLYGRKRQDED